MQTSEEVPERPTAKPAFVAMPASSADHPGEIDRHQPLAVVKRKRTKRPRHLPPASSASSSESTTTEEEDMAHCLILLAQGAGAAGSPEAHAAVDSKPSAPAAVVQQPSSPPVAAPAPPRSERYTSRKYTEAATTANGVRAGFYVYECKTCNKCFPTFQALGGHRASHKKPRLDEIATATNVVEVKPQHKPPAAVSPPPPSAPQPRIDIAVFPDVATALSLSSVGVSSRKMRVHECSICGAEFASGQALGGHMRRHRPLNAPPAIDKKEVINLELDLNLPAPSDEEAVAVSLPPPPPPAVVLGLGHGHGQFNDGNKAGLMLTASALVDCHY